MTATLTFEARYFGSPEETLVLVCDRIEVEQAPPVIEGSQRSINLSVWLLMESIDDRCMSLSPRTWPSPIRMLVTCGNARSATSILRIRAVLSGSC